MYFHITSVFEKDHLILRNESAKFLTSVFSFSVSHLWHRWISRLGGRLNFASHLLVIWTASWSPTPSIIAWSSVRLGVLVKKRSRMLSIRVGDVTNWVSPRSCVMSMNSSFIGFLYWLPVMVSVVQSMSGRLKSPASQRVEVLCFDLMFRISSQRDFESSMLRSGGLYAQAKMRGGFLCTLILANIDSDLVPVWMRELLRVFLIASITPPRCLLSLSFLYMS